MVTMKPAKGKIGINELKREYRRLHHAVNVVECFGPADVVALAETERLLAGKGVRITTRIDFSGVGFR